MVESPEIGDMWHEHIYKGKQPDKRLKRHPFHHIIPAKLKLVIGPDRSIIVRDKKTGEIVLVVMRRPCSDEGAVVAIDATVSDAIKFKKSIRVGELISFCA